MLGQGPFKWPILPYSAARIGIDIPVTRPAFFDKAAVQDVGCPNDNASDTGSDTTEGDDEGETNTRGTGSRHFSGDHMLLFLELARHLRSSSDLTKVLELAATLFGLDWSEVKPNLILPHRTTMSRALVRLDMLQMQWSRQCWKDGYAMAASWQAVCIRMYIYIYIYIYEHMCIYIYMYICKHIQYVCSFVYTRQTPRRRITTTTSANARIALSCVQRPLTLSSCIRARPSPSSACCCLWACWAMAKATWLIRCASCCMLCTCRPGLLRPSARCVGVSGACARTRAQNVDCAMPPTSSTLKWPSGVWVSIHTGFVLVS